MKSLYGSEQYSRALVENVKFHGILAVNIKNARHLLPLEQVKITLLGACVVRRAGATEQSTGNEVPARGWRQIGVGTFHLVLQVTEQQNRERKTAKRKEEEAEAEDMNNRARCRNKE